MFGLLSMLCFASVGVWEKRKVGTHYAPFFLPHFTMPTLFSLLSSSFLFLITKIHLFNMNYFIIRLKFLIISLISELLIDLSHIIRKKKSRIYCKDDAYRQKHIWHIHVDMLNFVEFVFCSLNLCLLISGENK